MKSNLEYQIETGEARGMLAFLQGYLGSAAKNSTTIAPEKAAVLAEQIDKLLNPPQKFLTIEVK